LIILTIVVLIFSIGCTPATTTANSSQPATPTPSVAIASRPKQTLPPSVADAVRRDISRRTGIPANQVNIAQSSSQTWPDGCLGLPKPDEFCTEALVTGWQVVATDGSQMWKFRTDRDGSVLRLESSGSSR
jgi:hypothetical protein